jgi:hypothetical protein
MWSFLTSCKTNDSSNIDDLDPTEEQNITFGPNKTYSLDDTPIPLNLEIDSKDELKLFVDRLLEKLKMFEYDHAGNETFFIEEYPMIRSELVFMITKRSLMNYSTMKDLMYFTI